MLVLYPHLPHYRYDIFRELEDDPRLEVFFAAGVDELNGIALIPEGRLRNVIKLRNLYVGNVLWQFGLARTLWKVRPKSIVYLADPHYLTTWLLAVVCKLTGIKNLFWTIGWHRPDGRIKAVIKRLFFGLADNLLLYAPYAQKLGRIEGVPDSRMTVIYNSSSAPPVGLPDQKPDFYEALAKVPNLVIGAVIRLSPQKRLPMIIEAAGLLRQRGISVEVLLVGEGPEEDRLRDLAEGLSVPLHLLGAAYGEEALAAVYERLSVTVVPSLAGLTAIQSLRHGVPAVTHSNPHNQAPESEAIVQGVTGGYFREGDVEDLAAAIAPYLMMSPEERAATAEACRAEVAARWSPSVQSGLIAQVALS